jgi:hypothetical protein
VHYLFVHAGYEWSGTARAFTAAAAGLAIRGHTVTMAVEPESTVERVVSQETVVAGRDPLFHVAQLSLTGPRLGAAWRLRTLARQVRADVVFVHTNQEHVIAATAFRFGSQAGVVRRVPAGQVTDIRRSGRMATRLAPTSFLFASEPDRQSAALPRRVVAGIVAPLGVKAWDGTPPTAGEYEEPAGEYIICVHDASSRSRAAMAIRTVAMLAPRHPGRRPPHASCRAGCTSSSELPRRSR